MIVIERFADSGGKTTSSIVIRFLSGSLKDTTNLLGGCAPKTVSALPKPLDPLLINTPNENSVFPSIMLTSSKGVPELFSTAIR